jgi:hypothetical protein
MARESATMSIASGRGVEENMTGGDGHENADDLRVAAAYCEGSF